MERKSILLWILLCCFCCGALTLEDHFHGVDNKYHEDQSEPHAIGKNPSLKNSHMMTNDKNGMEQSSMKVTHDWQNLEQDEVIPLGVDIKIGMKSAMKATKPNKEALDDEDELKYPIYKKFIDTEGSNTVTEKDLRRALKTLKQASLTEDLKHQSNSSKRLAKRLSEIKVLKELLEKYKKSEEEEKIDILNELEFMLHQYYVALEFLKLDGIDVLLPDLESKSPQIQELVALTFGSAAQGNPLVQQTFYERKAIGILLNLVCHSEYPVVQNRAMYALSAILRNLPRAQKAFAEMDGFSRLVVIIALNSSKSMKLKLKVVDLFHDLIYEKQVAQEHAAIDDDMDNLKLYNSYSIEDAVVHSNFCTCLLPFIDSSSFSIQEKILKTMLLITNLCREEFLLTIDRLEYLSQIYQTAALKELVEFVEENKIDDINLSDLYFFDLFKLTQNLINTLQYEPHSWMTLSTNFL